MISRDEPVTQLNMISLPPMKQERLLREFGMRIHDQIVLLFRPRLSKRQLRALKTWGKREVSSVDDDPKHSRSSLEWRKFLLPQYFTDRSSIYVHRTDDGPIRIFPESAAAERDAVLKIMGTLFRKH